MDEKRSVNGSAGRGVSVATLAEFNRSKIVRTLYREGECSRVRIAEMVGLTAASVGQIVTQLMDLGWVEEKGKIEGRGNRRAVAVALNRDRFHVIGVKFGPSRVEMCVFRLDGTPVSKTSAYAHWNYPPGTDAYAVADYAKQWIDRQIARDAAIVAVGVATPGPYAREESLRSGTVSHAEAAGIWNAESLRRSWESSFHVPVYARQDARAGVFAQWMLEPSNRGIDDLAYLMVGENVGLGVMEHGQIVNGAGGLAAQIGHISVDVNGRPCECGGFGCLKQYCCVDAMLKLIQERPALARETQGLSRREACIRVFELAHEEHADAIDVVSTIGTYIGHGCVTVMNAYNPRRIIIGDFMARGGDLLLASVLDVARTRTFARLSNQTEILLNAMGEDPVLYGAGAVAVEAILSHPTEFAERAQGGSAANGHEGVPAGQASLQ